MITLPLHAGTMATASAGIEELIPPFTTWSCEQTGVTSAGCDLEEYLDAGVISQATASMGNLYVYASTDAPTGIDAAFGSAQASFSMDQPFTGTTTWEMSVSGQGYLENYAGCATIMGQQFCTNGLYQFYTVTSSDMPISASISTYVSLPGPEAQEIELTLISAIAPEPTYGWIAGVGLAAMLAIRRKRMKTS